LLVLGAIANIMPHLAPFARVKRNRIKPDSGVSAQKLAADNSHNTLSIRIYSQTQLGL
jgi:hypothetical protein